MITRSLFALALIGAPAALSAQQFDNPFSNQDGKVFVTGVGEVITAPDRVRVSFSADSRSADRETASLQVRDLAASIRQALVNVGVPEERLKTTETSLGPVFDYGNNQNVPRIVGYTGSTTVEVTVDDANIAAAAIDAATQAGATRVSNPMYEISDPAGAEKEARIKAMNNAKEKADTLAEVGGFGVGQVITVSESGGSQGGYAPMMMMRADMAEASAAPTQIDTGQQTVSVSVSVTYEILPDDLSR